MFPPLDKQQEHRLVPFECQQEGFLLGLADDKPPRRFLPPADELSAVLGLTNILRAWQHTFATTAATCEILTAFLFKEHLSMMTNPFSRTLPTPRLISAVVLLIVFLASRPSVAQTRHIELNDFAKITSVSDPQISPDGKSIVVVVSRPNLEQDRSDRQLVLIEIVTGAQHVLTYDRQGVGSPRWSPSGDRLAFVAMDGAGKDAKPQILVLPMNAGEARKITDAPNGIEQFAWRPNGQEIAYVTSDEPENKKEIEKHHDAFEVGDNDFLATEAAQPSHLWIVSAEGGKAKRLTSGAWSLPKSAPPSSPASPISWSPDGKWLLLTRQEHPHQGDNDLTTLQVLNVETGEIRKLTKHEKFESFGLFSPDGSRVAYWYPRDGDPNNEVEIFVTETTGGDGSDATRAIDRDLQRVIWMPDGNSLLVGGHDGVKTSLWLQPLAGTAKKLQLDDICPSWLFWVDAFVGRKGDIAFTGSTPTQPSELYYMASATQTPKRLTDFNHEIGALALGKAERFEWKGPDGFQEDGVLFYPPDFQKDRKYPLVLIIHGGPTASTTTQFSFLTQLMSAHGYVVFSPNYRGSDNLGNAYQRAIWNDAGDGPGRDVIAGIDALKKLGFIDANKIGVTGWSYGGYMTSWLIGHYQIWKAAMAGAPVTDMYDEYNLSDGNVSARYGFKGSPYMGDNLKDYRVQSPITYATQMKTPTLIMHDTGDARVTITQGYSLYHALKDNGVPVKFIAYPVAGHFPGDPVRAMDVDRRWVEWMDQYLK
jgi:dipeptidyl aminopeptidase/acylaminoacyl peptidase